MNIKNFNPDDPMPVNSRGELGCEDLQTKQSWITKMNMIEKVARNLMRRCEVCTSNIDNFKNTQHYTDAKVAIEAMREPTNDQANEYFKIRKAAGDTDETACFNVSVWQSMIDAALKE